MCMQGLLGAAAKGNSAVLHSFKAALAQRLQELPLVSSHGQVRQCTICENDSNTSTVYNCQKASRTRTAMALE